MQSLAQRTTHTASLSVPPRCFRRTPASSTWVASAFATVEVPTAASTSPSWTSPHPEAQLRRLQYEQRRRQLDADRAATAQREAHGLKWFEPGRANTSTPANLMIVKSPEEFKQVLQQCAEADRLLVVECIAETCRACKSLWPKFKNIVRDNPDVQFVMLNGSEPLLQPMFMDLGIKSVPYVYVIRNREVVVESTLSMAPERLARFRAELAMVKSPPSTPAAAAGSSAALAASS